MCYDSICNKFESINTVQNVEMGIRKKNTNEREATGINKQDSLNEIIK